MNLYKFGHCSTNAGHGTLSRASPMTALLQNLHVWSAPTKSSCNTYRCNWESDAGYHFSEEEYRKGIAVLKNTEG